MNSNIYCELDKELLYNYHLLALKNGWREGFRHITTGITCDDIAPCHTRSGLIPFYYIYGYHVPKPCFNENPWHTITRNETDTICNHSGWSKPRIIPHTVIAKTIVDYIFKYWRGTERHFHIVMASEKTYELISLNKQKFGEQDNLMYQKLTDILELKQQEIEEERKRQEEERQLQEIEEIQRKQEKILVKYEYYFKEISKQKNILNSFGNKYGYYRWYKNIHNEVENEYYYLCNKEKSSILYAKAYMFIYKHRTSSKDRVNYANFIETAKKQLYKMDKNIIPVVPI